MGDLSLAVLDRRVVVTCTDPEVEAAVRETFADLVGDLEGPEAGRFDLDESLAPDQLTGQLTGLLGGLRRTVETLALGQLMPRAAAVAQRDGSVALVCGDPGAGVSTLAAALIGQDWAYLTDETSILDPTTLEVTPVHEPLSLEGRLVPAGTLSTTPVPAEPLEARLLVIPQHDPAYAAGTGGVHTTRLSGGEAAYLVGSRCARLADVSGGPLPALARLARRVPAYHLRYSDQRFATEEVTRLWHQT